MHALIVSSKEVVIFLSFSKKKQTKCISMKILENLWAVVSLPIVFRSEITAT